MINISKLPKDKKTALFVIGGIVIFFLLVFLGIIPGLKRNNPGGGGSSSGEINLEFWGVDPEENFTDLINSYQTANPGVKVVYKQVVEDKYEEELIDALAGRKGPDVLMIKNHWVLKHFEKLYPIAPTQISAKQLGDGFSDVVVKDMVYQDKIWGLPLYIDTLALYYNKDIFNSAGIAFPPTTWQEVQDDVRILTQKSISSDISKSGIALGTSKNINNADDVLSALMIQAGSEISDSDGKVFLNNDTSKQALSFYTSFANPASLYYSWNNFMGNSLESFSQGKTAMMLDFSSARAEIEQRNPHLNYGIAPFPQSAKNATNLKNYSKYWSLAVSAGSSNPSIAWGFIFYLIDSKQAKIYLEKAGLPPSSRILIKEMMNDKDLGVFTRQVLSAKSWIQKTPEKNSQIFKNMIELVINGKLSIDSALKQAEDEINKLLGY